MTVTRASLRAALVAGGLMAVCLLALAACGPVRVRSVQRKAAAEEGPARTISFELPERLRPSRLPSAQRGKGIYTRPLSGGSCAGCHGEEGSQAKPDFSKAEWIRGWRPPALRAALISDHPQLDLDHQLTLQVQYDVLAWCRFLATSSAQIRDTSTALFGKNCNVCHGNKGFGNGFLAPTMQPQPRNLAQFNTWGMYRSDNEIFYNIYYGVHWSGMPPWRKVVPDADIWKIVDFIRSLQYELPDDDKAPPPAANVAPAPAASTPPAAPGSFAAPTEPPAPSAPAATAPAATPGKE